MKQKITSLSLGRNGLTKKLKLFLIPVLFICCGTNLGFGQIAIANTTAVTQNFDGMAATITLPTNWRMATSTATPTWTGAATSVTQQVSTGSPTAGGTYNFGSSASERAVGAMTSGSFASPNNLLGFFQNTNASNLTSLTISYDAERYRINTAAASVQFFYSTDGTLWTAVAAGDIATTSFPTGASAYNFTTGTVVNKTGISISGLNIATNGTIYLRWNVNTTGANSQGIGIDNISVTGGFGVAATPTISTSGTIAAVSTTYGLASASPSTFSVSGADMTGGILVTPPSTNFEVSTTIGSGYANTITVGTAGTIASTPVYVRLKSTATVSGSPYSGNIVLTSSGASVVNVATASSTVSTKALTISGITANNKLYDGNTNATLSGTASLVGIVNSDVVTLGGTPVATFAALAVANGITVNVTSYTIGGAGAGNYSLTQPTLSANITSSPSPIINSSLTASATYGTIASTYTITASETPTSYNATGLPTGLSINTANGEITGTPTAATGAYNVAISATNGGGTGNANLVYTIIAKNLTVSNAIADNKIYDRLLPATISGSTLIGIVGSDTVTISTSGTFATATVSSGVAVISTQTLGGANAGNYTLTIPTGLTANITPKALTVTTAVAQNKVFDGNNAAVITGTLSGIIAPDAVTFSGTGTFASTAIANGILVTSTSTIGGADVNNYSLTQPTGLTANITAPIIAGWDFTGVGTTTIASLPATTFNSNLASASSSITRGTGAAWSTAGNSFRTTGFQNNGISTANTDFFQITLIANSGFSTSLSGIDARFSGTATFAASPGVSSQFSYSLNGTNFTLIGSPQITVGTPTSLPQIDLTGITALQNVAAGTTITLRYYASGQTTTGGWGFISAASGTNGLAVSGFVNVAPIISTSGSATAFTSTYGTASIAQNFTITGANLSSNITATAPTGFQVSSDATNFSNIATLSSSGGTLSVRLAANALVSGIYNTQNITLTSGATSLNIATTASGNMVSPLALSVSGVTTSNKIYTGNTIAIASGTPILSGVVGSDDVTAALNTATFANKNVGAGKTVTFTYTLNGTSATNYTLASTNTAADITAKDLTVIGIGIANKQFDTTTTATITGIAVLNAVETIDTADVSLGGTPIANFNDANVGTSKAVTVSGYSISGSASGNYLLAQPTGLTADISAAPLPAITSSLTASATYGAVASTYTITATNSPTSFNATGLPAGLNINTSNGEITGTSTDLPGVYNVNISATNVGGAGNAVLVYTILAKELTITGASVVSKTFDGTNTATVSGGTLNGIVGLDAVTFSGSATFSDANAGLGKTVTTSYTLGGADAAKYTLTQLSLTGDINKANQTITFGAIASKFSTDADFSLTATSVTSGTNAITYTSSNTAVATVTIGGLVDVLTAGTTTITASQATSTNYNAASDVLQSLIVTTPSFTAGNLVVARVGDGSVALAGGAAVPVFLSEFTTSGNAGYTVALPITTVGNTNRIVASGSATSENQLNLSSDGQYLTLGGYNAAVGTSSVNGSANPRVIARINNLGTIATTPIGAVHTSGFRSVASADGSRFWTAGNGTGIETTVFAGSTTSVVAPTVVSTTSTNTRTVAIFNNQLYFSTGSSAVGIYKVGTGLPTAASTTSTINIAGGDPFAYFILNRGGSNLNAYVAYTTGPGIYKWSSTDNGSTWTARGNVSTTVGAIGVVAQVNGTDVEVYATTGASLIKITDTAAFNATIAATSLTIATAATNTAFRGVSFAPVLITPIVNNIVLTASGTVDAVFSNYTVTAVNSPASFGATGLPNGLSINTATGVISGTPTVAGTFNVTISATNAAGTDASKTLVITIAKANQVITFATLPGKDISDADFVLTATSTSSANPIVYTSSDTNIATISGNNVDIIGNTGNVTITASQVGSANYNAAVSVDQILTVSNALAANQTITFAPLAAVTYGDAPFNLTASSDAGLTVTFTSSNPAVASVSGNTITIVGVGSANITASQGGNNDFNPAPNVIRALVVNQKQLTIINAVVTTKVFDNNNTATVTDGVLSGIVGSDAVTFSGTATFNDINANTNIALTTTYILAGADVAKYTLLQPTLTGTITKANQLIVFTAITPKTTFDVDVVLASFSTTAATNPVTFVSSDPSVLNVLYNATTLVYTLDTVGEGFATITASQATSANYNAAPDLNQTIIVRKVLYRNQFEGVSLCPTNGNVPVMATNTTGTPLTRATITCNSTANVFNNTTLNATTIVNDASYLEFAITVASGFKLDLKSVSFFRQASNSAPNQLEVRYSTDGFATSTSWGAAPISPVSGTIATWDFADFTTALAGTVTFRIYPYGTQRADLGSPSLASGTFRIDDLTIDGNLVQLLSWDGTSWSNGTGPTINDEAEINGNYNTTSNGTFSTKKLTINSGLFTIKSLTNLTVAEQLINSVPNTFTGNVQTAGFNIENNGNLIQSAVSNTNIGEIISSRINSSMRRLDYTYWSSPTASATYTLKMFSPQTVSLPLGTSRFYELNEVTNAFVGLDPLLTFFNTANAAKGFSIRAPNNFPTNGTTATFNANYIGVPNSGNITRSVTNSGINKGYNLIGNPYPSTIDALSFLNYSPDGGTTTPNAGTLYFWAHKTQAGTVSGSTTSSNYASFNLSGGTAATAGIGNSAPNGTIQVGQGFLLQKAANSTAVFNNAMRVGNNAGQFFRTTTTTEKHRIWLNLATEITPLNQMLVGYIEGATLGFDDSYDGKLMPSGSSISSLISTDDYVIQARPTPFENTDEVALGFKAETAGSYTLSIDHVDGLFLGDQNIYIKDNLLNVTHDIKASAYTFTSAQGTFNNRFDVVYVNVTLNIPTPTFDATSVIVYKNESKVLNINAGKVVMKNVKIYDVRGRLIYEKSNINTTSTALGDLRAEQEVLLVKITSDDNKVVTKKVVF